MDMTMTVRSWLELAKQRVSSLDADLILLMVLQGQDRSLLTLHSERVLEQAEREMATKMLEMRLRHVPMAYIMGWKSFYGLDFMVDSDVLIPRPETEDLVDLVLAKRPEQVLEVGTGSGCVAVAINVASKGEIGVVASDISQKALKVARKNTKYHSAKIKFEQSDLLQKFDEIPEMVVANLPYVNPLWEWVSPELKYEPVRALFTEDNGLFLIKRLMGEFVEIRDKMSKQGNKKRAYLILEADLSQHEQMIEYAEKTWKLKYEETKGLIVVFSYQPDTLQE